MTGRAAIGVDDDLAAGEARVALRAAGDERPGGVDVVLEVIREVETGLRQHRIDHVRAHELLQLLLRDVGVVLRREHHGVHGLGREPVVAERDLGLAVGPQERQLSGTAHLGEALRDAVRGPCRGGHELRGLVGGEAEHDALIARAELVARVGGAAVAVLLSAVDPVCDVHRLLAHRHGDAAGRTVEAGVAGGVADAVDHIAHDRGDVDVSIGADLARDMHEPRGDEGLDGHARIAVDGEQAIQDAVRDLIADLVGVSFGDGFGREQAQRAHRCSKAGCRVEAFRLIPQCA